MENKIAGGKKGKSVAFKLSSSDQLSSESSEVQKPANNNILSKSTKNKSQVSSATAKVLKHEMEQIDDPEELLLSTFNDFQKTHPTKKNKQPMKKQTGSNIPEKRSGAVKKGSKSKSHNVNVKKSSSVRQKNFSMDSAGTTISEREFQLSNVVRSAVRCLSQLREVKDRIGSLVSKDEQLSQGLKKQERESSEFDQLAQLSQRVTILSREAFLPAHRLNQAAICLHNTEDLFRSPTSVQINFSEISRMKIPPMSFNSVTVTKLSTCVDRATEFYNKFNCKGPEHEHMEEILLLVVRAFQDLQLAAKGCEDIFKFMLYVTGDEKKNLQKFIQTLPSVERVEMLVEVQTLRRTIDEIVIFLEKLSWGSYTVFCLASGKNVQTMPAQKSVPNPFEYSCEELMGPPDQEKEHSGQKKVSSHPNNHSSVEESMSVNPTTKKSLKLKDYLEMSSSMAVGHDENEISNYSEQKVRKSSKVIKKKVEDYAYVNPPATKPSKVKTPMEMSSMAVGFDENERSNYSQEKARKSSKVSKKKGKEKVEKN